MVSGVQNCFEIITEFILGRMLEAIYVSLWLETSALSRVTGMYLSKYLKYFRIRVKYTNVLQGWKYTILDKIAMRPKYRFLLSYRESTFHQCKRFRRSSQGIVYIRFQ